MASRKQLEAETLICHESAHNFFGNYLTATRWTDLFLHESLASYLAVRAVQGSNNDKDYIVRKH
jgi:aminopeptidase N